MVKRHLYFLWENFLWIFWIFFAISIVEEIIVRNLIVEFFRLVALAGCMFSFPMMLIFLGVGVIENTDRIIRVISNAVSYVLRQYQRLYCYLTLPDVKAEIRQFLWKNFPVIVSAEIIIYGVYILNFDGIAGILVAILFYSISLISIVALIYCIVIFIKQSLPFFHMLAGTNTFKDALDIHWMMKRAMSRVTVCPETKGYLVDDMGLLVYETENPYIIRNTQIPFASHYIRPFVKLLSERDSSATLTFQIRDAKTHVKFNQNHMISFKGTKWLCASLWLDLGQIERVGTWSLCIRIDGKALAILDFSWSQINYEKVKREHRKDGEISAELQRMLAKEQNKLTSMSLDELLGE